jgi:hypothetical protein
MNACELSYAAAVMCYRNIDALEDVLIGLTDDEDEAKRIATIAGNMKIGDTFSGRDIYLKCKTEE